MLKKLTPEEISKRLENLPEESKEAFFSIETAEKISEACEKYAIPAEKIPFVVNYVAQILLGFLPLGEFKDALEKEAGLKKEVAENVSQQIHRSIFSSLKENLTMPLRETGKTEQIVKKDERKPSFLKHDNYREPII